jgi:hypothetical protein
MKKALTETEKVICSLKAKKSFSASVKSVPETKLSLVSFKTAVKFCYRGMPLRVNCHFVVLNIAAASLVVSKESLRSLFLRRMNNKFFVLR